ncbi:52 kDa repressor of the inhibitor of the protein kinase-like [Ixodes scapularis]|uniref:52 kDa repressor of the inhibitor of the protein kinase-like n=1 Tax=Ixodes scapularis TaxID=6945 RepID=UPI001C384BD8|nr:52 kDa repressor of the inhibitor of the protein kinase-like [Ixodes scapularis]
MQHITVHEAMAELRTLESLGGDLGTINVERVAVLLSETVKLRTTAQVEMLSNYLCVEELLMVEAEFRFKSTMKDMTTKVDLIKKVFNDTSCAQFLDIDNNLLARLAKSCLNFACVPFCKSDRKRKLGISFHKFPANDDRRQAWLKAISRKDFVPNDKSSSSVVCSLHFADSDYTLGSTKLRRLKRDAVPSIFSGYPTYMHPQKPQKRRKLERVVQDFPSHKKKGINATSTRQSNSDCYLPSVPEVNTEASFQGAGHDGGHLPQTSISHVSLLGPKEDQVATGTKTSAQDAVGDLQRPTNSVDCAAQTCDDLLPRKQSDARAINRMRAQLFRKADTARKLQRENSRLKKSSVAYRYIRYRGLLKLPSKNTLLRYVGKSDGESGITPLMKEGLKEEVNE